MTASILSSDGKSPPGAFHNSSSCGPSTECSGHSRPPPNKLWILDPPTAVWALLLLQLHLRSHLLLLLNPVALISIHHFRSRVGSTSTRLEFPSPIHRGDEGAGSPFSPSPEMMTADLDSHNYLGFVAAAVYNGKGMSAVEMKERREMRKYMNRCGASPYRLINGSRPAFNAKGNRLDYRRGKCALQYFSPPDK